MVSRESATRNLCHSQPSLTIQIDENHSDMVKFGIGDHYIGILASKLDSICTLSETSMPAISTPLARKPSQRGLIDKTKAPNPWKGRSKTRLPQKSILPPEWTNPNFWDDDKILSSLRAPERDRRLEQINQKLGNTFNWVYDDTSVGLSEWLQKGAGIFWINGKPASGKSTLMKYLYQDPRTHELLRAGGWKSRARLATASFFFHHRGNSMQKSFEGLLRSLVSQILEQERSLFPLLYPILVDQYRTRIVSSGLDNLEKDVWALVSQLELPSSSQLFSEVRKIVTSQRELTESRQLGIHLERMLNDSEINLDSQPPGPYDEFGLDDVEMILSSTIEPSRQAVQGKMSQWLDPTSSRALVNRTLQRHYRRERIKMDAEARNWSRENLEECLRQLVGQSLFEMDLFLFLDALDEYDGRPEFIASFLQDLVSQPTDLSKQSSTHIRILFSSRPWKALNDEFAACPGFQIHDYTWNDIIDFCAASIPSDETAKAVLSPFVTEIVCRARGVFLWVELVMRDLAQTVLQRVQQQEIVEGLKQELRQTLENIPDELDAYYQIIVQRIPPGTRWGSYVVLETLCRSVEDVETATLLAILKCSNSMSLAGAKENLNKGPGSQIPLPGTEPEWGERYIKAVSGGLVEVGGLSAEGKPIVQFMHQTVKQFVLGPRFKLQLLGTNVGTHVTENGHSFISKYLFVESHFGNRFFYYAREAEATTGFSQYGFFSTALQSHYVSFSGVVSERLPCVLAMAVLSGLQLCFSDAYEADRCFIQRNSESLVSLLLVAQRLMLDSSTFRDDTFLLEGSDERIKDGAQWDRIINMADFLVANGLSIDDDQLLDVVRRMWEANHRDRAPVWFSTYESLAVTLVGALPCRSESTAEASSLSMATQSTTGLHSTGGVTKLLHFATPRLAQAILARGFDPNSLNHLGATPIDSVLVEGLCSQNLRKELLDQYDMVSQLVHHGGLLSSTRRSRWVEWENTCARSGLDLSVFRDAGFPLWYSRWKVARKHRGLRWFLFGPH